MLVRRILFVSNLFTKLNTGERFILFQKRRAATVANCTKSMATFQYQFHSEKLEKCFRLQINQERECCVLDHWWTKQQWVDWNRTQRCSKPCVLATIRHERQTLLLATTGKMSCPISVLKQIQKVLL